ncbi:carboxypeptidase-like regulatory domain-containing protein [Mucilaginibacter sp. dw_454]|uniref:carboxypeptidase-like regulatory domain-containing protein n=1 Tax=Mucilaginibacter sp. dw_454 TaxID=2720079 RepID=UPI001BD6A7F1|nr:carboxypeptidase-like regulatory domain-containing protein [Mucilaginibacter sp. dw_454]
MKLLRIFLLMMMPAISWAQSVTITGKITAADTKAAVAGASVFLSNSSFGTSTTKDGTFILNGLKQGQYNLVVSSVGYEDQVQVVSINDAAVTLNVELQPKVNELKEVTISTMSKSDKREALEQFKQDFIGTDANAADCKILNPDVLNFAYHQNKTVLEAYADQFLVIENHALGYRIKFLLKNFRSELQLGNVAYAGSQVFEEMKASKWQQKKWQQKRDEAYYGSAMHFYRSLFKDSLEEGGYRIYNLSRDVNEFRPTDSEIEAHIAKARQLSPDSLKFWNAAARSSRYANQKFHGRFNVKDILKSTVNPNLKELTFPNHLYVVYTKKWEVNYYKEVYRSPGDLNYQTTIVSLINDNRSVMIDKNGTVVGKSPSYEGSWSQARLSVLLPVDYTPYSTQDQFLESQTLKRD